jgi:DNA-binding response OmpR family regulator
MDALAFAGYKTLEARNGTEGMGLVRQANFDLLLLDLILPGAGGFDILRVAREFRATLPIIVLTARGEEEDRVKGLRLGADDYMVKPFSIRELLARVEAVLRRSPERPHLVTTIPLPDGVADLARSEIRHGDGERHDLSERETGLLRYLASNAGRAISRDEILLRVWRLNPTRMETRTIDMHIANLREKLRDKDSEAKMILTVRGKGYMFARCGEGKATGEEE